tara:strand:+ start:581 stop:784 length:204 start_codon:yes stop_codon:yes gene_type:complete
MAIDKRIASLLAKKYKKKLGTRVGDSRNIRKQLTKGATVSQYMAKDGGYIEKKGKKVVKKRKITKKR